MIEHRHGDQKGQGNSASPYLWPMGARGVCAIDAQMTSGKISFQGGRNPRAHVIFAFGRIRKDPLMMKVVIALAVLSVAAAGSGWAQDVEKGQNSFKKCLPCHRIGPDAKNLVGPELNGLDGRKSGMVEGFNYSDANKNSGIVWNEASFKEYIKDPRAKIPGTKMTFAGIKNDDEINDLWAYLKQFDAQGNIKK
jgi:cytochrome c